MKQTERSNVLKKETAGQGQRHETRDWDRETNKDLARQETRHGKDSVRGAKKDRTRQETRAGKRQNSLLLDLGGKKSSNQAGRGTGAVRLRKMSRL